jgi:plastocyanin
MKIHMRAAVAAAVLLPALALAAEPTVGQKDKQFSEAALKIKAGQAVKFVNDDTVAHNITIKSPDGASNLGLQKPGAELSHSFEKIGEYEVRCGIHPKMKMAVTAN